MGDMNKNRKDFETYRSIRKPIPRPSKVIPSEKDLKRDEKFDWRKETKENHEDHEEK